MTESPSSWSSKLRSSTRHAFLIGSVRIQKLGRLIKLRGDFWKRLFTVTILASFLYITMEWVFLVSMPSFMSIMGFTDKVQILLVSGFAYSIFWLVILAGFIIFDVFAIIAHFSEVNAYFGAVIPTLIITSLALLLIDNFTYTVFKFGISTSSGVMRGAYAVLFIVLGVYVYLQVLRVFRLRGNTYPAGKSIHSLFIASLIMLAVGLVLTGVRLEFAHLLQPGLTTDIQSESKLPNIILLGSDGLNAQNLSVYGYRRNTTPQLAELATTSLVAENAFTNAGNSAGSVISILTSKLPTQTRVLYPPNILTGENSYQHLPGILKGLGYKTIEFGVPFYVDAYNYNLQNGFDIVNNRTLSVGKRGDLGRRLGYEDEVYFLSWLIWRISDRLQHIFYIRAMQNPFDVVTQTVPTMSDANKINQLVSAFDQMDQPLFIHAHLMGTHGGYYEPPDQLFSIGKDQIGPWMDDFYDDTLRAYDSYMGRLIYHLKKEGKFDNTILIIYSDHNKEFKVNERVPLIIHFPNGEYAGRISQTVQNLDIAPTIVDYLGLPIPDWMEGESLLSSDAGNRRIIFSTGTHETKPNEDQIAFLDAALDQPPFYQFSYINVIDCQNWYSFDLNSYVWSFGVVSGYVDPCDPQKLYTLDEIEQVIYKRLRMDGFDTSSLP